MKKILLIDDSVTIHRVIDICIDKDKFITEKTFSADDAVMKLKNSPADIVLLDNKLEGITLLDFIGKIRSLAQDAWIILLTGAFDQFDDNDLIKSGADDYLFKPFDSQAIEAKINYGLNSVREAPASAPAPAMPEQVIAEEETEILEPEETQAEEEAQFIDLQGIPSEADVKDEEPESEDEAEIEAAPEEDALSAAEFADADITAEEAVTDEPTEEIPSADDIFSADEPEEVQESLDLYGENEEEFPFDDDAEPSIAVSEEEKAELGNLFAETDEPEPEIVIEDTDEQPDEDLDSFLKGLEETDVPEAEVIEEEQEIPETAPEDFTDLLDELVEKEEPAPEYIIEEEPEGTDPFAGLMTVDEESVLSEPKAAEEQKQETDENDIFAGLTQISVEEVADGKPKEPEEEIQPEEPEAEEITEIEETALDLIPEGFLQADAPVDGEIVEEAQEPDLTAEALESMPIDTDFADLTPADDAGAEIPQLTDEDLSEPAIIREEEPEEALTEMPEPETEPEAEEILSESLFEAAEEETAEIPAPEEEPEADIIQDEEAELTAFEEFPEEQFAPLKDIEEEAPQPAAAQSQGLAQEEIKEIVYRSLDSGMLKSAIQEVLSEKMEEVLREVLPEIAEMVIREEIERLKRGE
jgi:DNA-binding response OmpR family regulator